MTQTVPSRPVPEPGLAGSRSVAWQINRERVQLMGWGTAVLRQLAHPLVAQGVADHSVFVKDPLARTRRLHQTINAMLALTFGSAEEAARAADGINRIHDYVHGTLKEDTPRLPAGTRYSAHDPELLRWVHATLIECFPLAYRLYIGSLSAADEDRYCLEASALGPRLGLAPGYLPQSVAENRAYMRELYLSGQIHVTDTARALARELLHPPYPRVMEPLLELMRLPTIGLLPPALREQYGFPWSDDRERALRTSAFVIRTLIPFAPRLIRDWPPARAAFARSEQSGWAARLRGRLRGGRR